MKAARFPRANRFLSDAEVARQLTPARDGAVIKTKEGNFQMKLVRRVDHSSLREKYATLEFAVLVMAGLIWCWVRSVRTGELTEFL